MWLFCGRKPHDCARRSGYGTRTETTVADLFSEESRPVSLFFRMVYRPQNCLVYLFHGKVASAVHLLPCSVQLGGGRTAQAHYIYAAATFPEYRGKGLMASLLAYAALYGAAHGQTYSLGPSGK